MGGHRSDLWGARPGDDSRHGAHTRPVPSAEITEFFRRQHGVVSRAQLLDAGMTVGQIRHERASGRLVELHPSVYGLVGHRESWRRRLWAAQLHAGGDSAVGFESAGRLHGLDQVPAGRVVLAVAPGRRHPPRGVRWHRVGDLDPSDICMIGGLPVTTAARTIVDLSSVSAAARLRLMAEQAVLERRCTPAELGALLGRVRRRGKPGIARMERVLDEIGPGTDLPRSELERLTGHVIDLAGLPPPRHEHPLPNERGRVGFVDRCWEEAMWILEADGRRWHGRHHQMLADADRMLESQALGYATTRLLWEHARHDPSGTAVLLRAVYDQRVAVVAALRRFS